MISDSEQTIHPSQTTGIKELPSECELHHFKAKGYSIKTCVFTITREFVIKKRVSGNEISSYYN